MDTYKAFCNVPQKELVYVLKMDDAGEEVTQVRIDGEWVDLGVGPDDQFDYLLVDTIDPSKLDKFLKMFDTAEKEFKTLYDEDVKPFIKKREKVK